MLKVLIKKQMMESWKQLFYDPKKGRMRSTKSKIRYGLLFAFLGVYLFVVFYHLSKELCEITFSSGLSWFFYMLLAILAITYGLIASIFSGYSSLYLPKDNDILIPLPIKEKDLILSRLMNIYLLGLFYESIVYLPAILAGQITGGFDLKALIFSILMLIVTSFFILAMSALLGYLVAMISVKIQSKAMVIVVISLAFIGLYFYLYSKILSGLSNLELFVQGASVTVHDKIFLLYHLGQAHIGNLKSMLIMIVLTGILTVISYQLVVLSFSKAIRQGKGEKKRVYKAENNISRSVDLALLRKEFMRFTKSASYMLNCSLGTIILPILGIYLLVKPDSLSMISVLMIDHYEFFPAAVCGILCMVGSMNDITAPSISLEGKSIWILQSMPVHPWRVLKAKMKLHLYLSLIPALFAGIVLCVRLDLSLFTALPVLGLMSIFIVFSALSGLALGLKFANLNYTNETSVIKQGLAPTIAILGDMGIVTICGVFIYLLADHLSITVILYFLLVIFMMISIGIYLYLKTKGSEIFAHL